METSTDSPIIDSSSPSSSSPPRNDIVKYVETLRKQLFDSESQDFSNAVISDLTDDEIARLSNSSGIVRHYVKHRHLFFEEIPNWEHSNVCAAILETIRQYDREQGSRGVGCSQANVFFDNTSYRVSDVAFCPTSRRQNLGQYPRRCAHPTIVFEVATSEPFSSLMEKLHDYLLHAQSRVKAFVGVKFWDSPQGTQAIAFLYIKRDGVRIQLADFISFGTEQFDGRVLDFPEHVPPFTMSVASHTPPNQNTPVFLEIPAWVVNDWTPSHKPHAQHTPSLLFHLHDLLQEYTTGKSLHQ